MPISEAAALSKATPEAAESIRRDLDRVGVAVFQDFFAPEVRDVFAQEIVAAAGRAKPSGPYKYSLKYDEITDHAIYRLVRSPAFAAFANRIMRGHVDYEIQPSDITMGYSIIKNRGDRVPYHFDALNCLNFIFPIVQPPRPAEYVDLVCLPNVIGFRRSLSGRLVSRVLALVPGARSLFSSVRLSYNVGSLYAFYGCRTLHGVEPYAFQGLRAIASINVRWRQPR